MSPRHDDLAPTEAMPLARSRGHERFLPGTVLAHRYRIVALLGRGGMGDVYRADDLKIGQPVALKFLSEDLERDPDRLQRLLGEVRIARQVSHPNVCRVHDVDEFEGHHFITMEYVDGEDLAALLRRIGRLPQEKALDLARQIGAGLAAAHVQGIVHRDLKPANIMLDGRGRARITDFGLAAAAEAVRGKEAQLGTPAYMAPEQLAGEAITPRTDVYALGLVLFEMFTGRRVLQVSAKSDIGSRVEDIPARPSTIVPGLDPAIDTTILKCIETDPARRPHSAVGLLALLPGGDPLDSALRAGETPSPEMVAAAGDEGSLSSARAWALFGLALVSMATAILLGASVAGLDQVQMTRSPEVLGERASDIARQLGGDVPPHSREWWIDLDDGYAAWAHRQPRTISLAHARPSAVRFNYRQSPGPIAPLAGILPTRHDPAPSLTGESYVSLDPQGRLLEFSRLDRQLARPDSAPAAPVDWTPLLALTGADVGRLQRVEPLWTPDVPCDTRAAWAASDGGETVRLEAAAWRGQPVWLRTIAPWERAERDAPARPLGYTGFGFFVAAVVAILLAFAALARHNLRLGRGDMRGALRVGLAVFVCFGLGYSLCFRWSLEPLHVWRWLQHQEYFPAMAAWLTYLGIEPFLRRRSPHRLIAWTRLLDGRFADPLVGRELLLAFPVAAAIALASCIPAVLERGHDVDFLVATLPLGRAADFWGSIAGSVGEGLMRGLGSFAFFLLLRVLLRREAAAWLGVWAMWVLVSLPSSTPSLVQWISLAVGAAGFVLAARVGVLAAVAAIGLSNLLVYCTPLTLDFSRWYAWRTGVIAALLLAIAVWGFRAVMGRRRILSATMFEG
jgi:serine/threonine-protein kinase